jgi:pyridoxamine 5'-phosphate oxidase-like protein
VHADRNYVLILADDGWEIKTAGRSPLAEDTLWIATAASDGGAHLVPFSCVWDGERLSKATAYDNPAARNAARTGKARIALDNIQHIVLIDGAITVMAREALDDSLAERLRRVSAIDARQAPGYVYLQLTPVRIQAWWSAAELARPTIMQERCWLTP